MYLLLWSLEQNCIELLHVHVHVVQGCQLTLQIFKNYYFVYFCCCCIQQITIRCEA